ncbi:MAG TPA: hypothetical protein V6C82_06480 [Chroococcales cyanobacterium]|jgi:lipid-A-disaccharide synthase
MQADIILVSNGPGELAAWVRPVVRQLRRDLPAARLILALVPCPYASGNEAKTAAGWPEGLIVWTPRETIAFLLKPNFPLSSQGIVLFLGGDQFFGLGLSRRSGFPLLVYTEGFVRWIPWTSRFLLSDLHLHASLRSRGIPSSKLSVVGNLMVDAIQPQFDPAQVRERLELRTDSPVLSLLPGSKPFKLKYLTPLFLKVAEEIEERKPDTQFVLHRSPFTPIEQLEQIVKEEKYRNITGGTGGRIEFDEEKNFFWIVTDGGTRIRVIGPEDQYSGMAIADLALTVPGTNTAELAILGIPMLVVLPLNKPEEIPLDGLIGRIGEIPLLGARLKRWLIPRLARSMPFVALPNQRAKRTITPEAVGVLEPRSIAQRAIALLEDPEQRRRIKLDLLQVMGHHGAAEAIAESINDQLAIRFADKLPATRGRE